MVGALSMVGGVVDSRLCPCLCIDALSLSNGSFRSSGDLVLYRNLLGRKQSKRPASLELSSSFVNSWYEWRLPAKVLSEIACKRSRRQRKNRNLVIVDELAGQYEENFDDVTKQILNYFTHKAVRTVLNQLYEMNPPQYRWLSAFTMTAYLWAVAYLITITTEMVYIKHIVMNLGLSTWGFVFYNNLLSVMMAPVFWVLSGEYKDVLSAIGSNSWNWVDRSAILAVALSCVFGLMISFFGFAARKAISATAFTVTGVVNKFLTVAINVVIWDKHASPVGLVCLFFTIVGGVFYQRSVSGGGGGQKEPALAKLMDGRDGAVDLDDEKDQGMKV